MFFRCSCVRCSGADIFVWKRFGLRQKTGIYTLFCHSTHRKQRKGNGDVRDYIERAQNEVDCGRNIELSQGFGDVLSYTPGWFVVLMISLGGYDKTYKFVSTSSRALPKYTRFILVTILVQVVLISSHLLETVSCSLALTMTDKARTSVCLVSCDFLYSLTYINQVTAVTCDERIFFLTFEF